MAGDPLRYEVLLTHGAEQDLESIYDYIAEFGLRGQRQLCSRSVDDGCGRTGAVSRARCLSEGACGRSGIKEYRQTAFKPYRVIYRIVGSQVVIYMIVDGRRDMQSVLARRFLAT